MADLHVTKDRIDIIDDYTGENKSIMLDKNTKAVVVSFGADETPVEMASNTSVQSLVTQEVTEQLPALLEDALTDYAKKTDIGDGVVSIYQGDSLAGSFTTNQGTDSSISLAAGGGSSELNNVMLKASASYAIDGWALADSNMHYSDYKYTQVGIATVNVSSLSAAEKALIKSAILAGTGKCLCIGLAETNEWNIYSTYPVGIISVISDNIDDRGEITVGIKAFSRINNLGYLVDWVLSFIK